MDNDCISYQDSGYFTQLITDYLDQKPELKSLYHRFPTVAHFKLQLEEKKQSFPPEHRRILLETLIKQYTGFSLSDESKFNIEALKDSNTFTITTGHQLNLLTGPLYFIYKIVSVINLCKQLKAAYPEHLFVPVYWMATEDHDFEEINHFHFKGKKIFWDKQTSGPVGRISTDDLTPVFDVFSKELGIGENASLLKKLFEDSYIKHNNLADATRFLANELFKDQGLVIVDGDDKSLKNLFVPYVKKELLEQTTFHQVTDTLKAFSTYNIQVNPREINLFYIEDGLRERIVFEKGSYLINNTSKRFTEAELLNELEQSPEKFSPNVLLRPVYQEVILPNLCYIGGGGEIAYWLELKNTFTSFKIPLPVLLVRNSVVVATEKQLAKAEKLGLSWSDLFSNQQRLFDEKTKEYTKFTFDFAKQKEFLSKQFDALTEIAKQTDISFIGAVKAQEAKQLKGLEALEKRFLKAEKRVYTDKLERILLLQNELFPNQGLQERKLNFSEFYLTHGTEFIEKTLKELNPLSPHFTIITLS